ncbi:hypothetical protein ABEF94_010017 [Exophiala dermatitidis]
MADELKWSAKRKDVEWKNSVNYLLSMGLPADLLNITRAEVEKGLTDSNNLAPTQGSSKTVEPLRASSEPTGEASAPLP